MSAKVIKLCCIIFIFSEIILYTHSAELLLVFPCPAKSHFYTLSPLITALADKGHKITAYTTLQFGPHPNINETIFEYDIGESIKNKDMTSLGSLFTLLLEIHDIGYQSAVHFVKTKEFHELMSSNRQYDGIIAVSITIQEYLAVLRHKFNNTVTIEVVPHANAPNTGYFSGIPFNPSYYIDMKLPYTDVMNFWERLHNTYNSIITLFTVYFVNIRRMEYIASKYMRYPGWEDRPSLLELITRKSLILVNGHHAVNYPYPLPPHVIDIAGININPNQSLPKEIENFMNSWPNGVIVISWGSLVKGSKMSNDQIDRSFLSAFSTLKQGVIWKTNKSSFCVPVPPNVMAIKWLPQQAVLAHKNVKLFLTHAGFNSMVETVYYGVPVVVTPFFFDQGKNARKLVDVGMGVEIQPENITKESIIWAIDEVINNKRYKEAALRRSTIFRDRPMTPVQEATYWIEYVLKHGDILRPGSTNMPLYKLLLFDIFAFILCTIFILYFIIKKLLSYNYKTLFQLKNYSNKKLL